MYWLFGHWVVPIWAGSNVKASAQALVECLPLIRGGPLWALSKPASDLHRDALILLSMSLSVVICTT